MSFARKSNLKELSVAEIDDLIKEKSSTLKYTEEKLNKGDNQSSTHRRRDHMKSNQPLPLLPSLTSNIGLMMNSSPKEQSRHYKSALYPPQNSNQLVYDSGNVRNSH